ncbi:hypothetical protein CANCADRAFT_31198 [Tortispora caseinolytica NRRL Y-17796]|uniref:CDC20/Fizzy WD40 domain-containing protein n=1 Tax=Tortispora caseinolytica NRRL Y-17796 TaxID=767744 RepID=A0A1E4TEF7_9ASCO|nr:hypothetical protein CANCADRAFT_31198 [Tortispora caseinolytica NRRL Y-17796]
MNIQRPSTPPSQTTSPSAFRSPSRSIVSSPGRQRLHAADRFIPTRGSVDLTAAYSLIDSDDRFDSPPATRQTHQHPPDLDPVVRSSADIHERRIQEANKMFSQVLKAEIFGDKVPSSNLDTSPSPSIVSTPTSSRPRTGSSVSLSPARKLFQYSSPQNSPKKLLDTDFDASSHLHSLAGSPNRKLVFDADSPSFSTSPVRIDTQKLLTSPKKEARHISPFPSRVLDAPELADDFYLNNVDWSSSNILAVGLGSCVYLWIGSSAQVLKLCDFSSVQDTVTSVSWIDSGDHIAVGTFKGTVQIWDAEKAKRIRVMSGHTARACSLAWNRHILSSGSRDRSVLHRDVRAPEHFIRRLSGHKQEVCGLKWNTTENLLASGSNDNKLFIWDALNDEAPMHRFTQHTAAVKALAWSPHQRSLLASGGGSADRTIRFWNTSTGALCNTIDTGSQVCNLMWSKNSNELVSTHGFSQNQIAIWKYPSMRQVTALYGHTYRVLFLSMSPDGQTIVTGAGDETLRFWQVFKKSKSAQTSLSRLDSQLLQIR